MYVVSDVYSMNHAYLSLFAAASTYRRDHVFFGNTRIYQYSLVSYTCYFLIKFIIFIPPFDAYPPMLSRCTLSARCQTLRGGTYSWLHVVAISPSGKLALRHTDQHSTFDSASNIKMRHFVLHLLACWMYMAVICLVVSADKVRYDGWVLWLYRLTHGTLWWVSTLSSCISYKSVMMGEYSV